MLYFSSEIAGNKLKDLFGKYIRPGRMRHFDVLYVFDIALVLKSRSKTTLESRDVKNALLVFNIPTTKDRLDK